MTHQARQGEVSHHGYLGLNAALELSARASEVAGPTENLDLRVLVDRVTLVRAKGDHVPVLMRAQEDVLGVQREHQRGTDVTADAAVENNVCIHEFNRRETKRASFRRRETLNGLERGHEVRPVDAIRDNQVRAVRTTNLAGPHGVHRGLDGCRRRSD